MIKSDRWIRRMAQEHDMINPYSEKQVSAGVISYGVSSYGYDLARGRRVQDFYQRQQHDCRPKHFDERSFVTVNADVAIVPPNSFALARSVEYFKIPRDVLTICVGKSTYARCGIIVNVTPFEPEWEGFVTLEISNTTPLPAKIYANEGLCQILFLPVGRGLRDELQRIAKRENIRRRRGSCCRTCAVGRGVRQSARSARVRADSHCPGAEPARESASL
jgi:dCTP deaminase